MTAPDSNDSAAASVPDESKPAAPPPKKTRWWSARVLKLTLGLALGVLVLGVAALGGAEYYTARPKFCGTCHVMDPYYVSWTHDKHGAKFDVWCVDCHYAPGQHHTITAKFRGLSQVTSYFSGRYGQSRPRARVADASCMRSGCHGDGEHLNRPIPIGEERIEKRVVGGRTIDVKRTPTVHFVHAKHLEVKGRLEDANRKIEELSRKFKSAAPGDVFARLERAVGSVRPALPRETELRKLLTDSKLDDMQGDAQEWMRLEHMKLRLAQLAGIHCSSCHTFDQSGKHHVAVDRTACYTCHFVNQAFNRDTGECLKCHEPPTREIVVHGGPAAQGPTPAVMDHRDIVTRGIDCASCHLDVIQGEASVTVRDCTNCHDQAQYYEKFEQRTVADVEEYHRAHVEAQRARCIDCHRIIRHQLVDPASVASSVNVIKPVLDDCQHCHPNHHREQVDLLMGVGGKGIDQPVPNAMFGSRMNCRACHTQEGDDFKGDPLVKATQQTCVSCHGSDYEKLFAQWMNEIANYVKEAEAGADRLEKRAAELAAAGKPTAPEVAQAIASARQNVQLVKNGNGIHNKNYTMQLLDVSIRELDRVMMKLAAPIKDDK